MKLFSGGLLLADRADDATFRVRVFDDSLSWCRYTRNF
jgi:hypothetical protein